MTRALLTLFLFSLGLVALIGCGEPDAASTGASLGETRVGAVRDARLRALPASAQEVVSRSRLPLLVPRDPQLLSTAVVTAGPRWIALSAAGEGFTVALHGTNQAPFEIAEETPPASPNDTVRGAPAVVSENDGIRTATWDEAGMAWALDVECHDVEQDARCADDTYLRSLAEQLELIGGGP